MKEIIILSQLNSMRNLKIPSSQLYKKSFFWNPFFNFFNFKELGSRTITSTGSREYLMKEGEQQKIIAIINIHDAHHTFFILVLDQKVLS